MDEGESAEELLRAKTTIPALVSVDPTTLVRDALALLRHHGISQMPVLAGKENVGAVQEEDILRAALGDDTVIERTVTSVLGPKLGEVTQDAPLGEIVRRLKEERAVLVREAGSGRPLGVLTRHDLLSFFTRGGDRHDF